ncbi:hypothetical protein D3C73_1487800 [compost metagenome]
MPVTRTSAGNCSAMVTAEAAPKPVMMTMEMVCRMVTSVRLMPTCNRPKLGHAHSIEAMANAIRTGRRPTRSASLPAKGNSTSDTPTEITPASNVSRIDMPVIRWTCEG